MKVFIASCSLVILSCWVVFEYSISEYRLSIPPQSLTIRKILYSKEQSWGFGPGGNETGIVVYELSPDAATLVARQGNAFLEKLRPSPNTDNSWEGKFSDWKETPIALDQKWHGSGEVLGGAPPSRPLLANYLNKYGFGIPINPLLSQEIDVALYSRGSYYAYGRAGIIIVIPARRKVVFAFAR